MRRPYRSFLFTKQRIQRMNQFGSSLEIFYKIGIVFLQSIFLKSQEEGRVDLPFGMGTWNTYLNAQDVAKNIKHQTSVLQKVRK